MINLYFSETGRRFCDHDGYIFRATLVEVIDDAHVTSICRVCFVKRSTRGGTTIDLSKSHFIFSMSEFNRGDTGRHSMRAK
jgi:hypothetical protein